MKSAQPLQFSFVALLISIALTQSEAHEFFRFKADTPGNSRSGTLRYERGKLVISGPVLLRTTYYGDFLFLFTDQTGHKLIELQQDRSFARISGKLIGTTWEGETETAPSNVSGWLSLSPLFVNQVIPKSVKKTYASEKFEFGFSARRGFGHLGF